MRPRLDRLLVQLGKAVARDERDRAIGARRRRRGRRVRRRVIAEKAALEPYQAFGVVGVGSRRIRDRIGDPPIHGREAGGVGVTEIGDLDGRGAAGKDAEPVPHGVPGKIDQDVDAVGANALDDFAIAEPGDRTPQVGVRPKPKGHVVLGPQVGVADDEESGVVVAREHGFDETGDRVAAEVR